VTGAVGLSRPGPGDFRPPTCGSAKPGHTQASEKAGEPQSTRLVMAADHPTTSLNYPNHAAASFRNIH
jgi:hypothetical protein